MTTTAAEPSVRNRRLVLVTLVVIGIEVVLSSVVYGWDMASGVASPGEWESDEWLSLFGAIWIVPMSVLIVKTYGLYRRSSAASAAMREELEAARRVEDELRARTHEGVTAVSDVIASHLLVPHFQPIVRLDDGETTTVGFEALARFPTGSPQSWFATAGEVGMTVPLELEALRQALDHAQGLPSDTYLSLNASPETIDHTEFFALFRDIEAERIVIEITETLVVEDYERTNRILAALRRLGANVAVDDAGAGYASLRHIVNLRPDMIKVDRSLIEGVNGDAPRRAMARALASFGAETGATVVAEGVETEAEAATLRDIGIRHAQGFLFARPAPADQWHSA